MESIHWKLPGSLVVFACEINAFLFQSELNASLHKETAIYSFILWGWTEKGRRRRSRREGDESPWPSIHPNRVLQTLSQSERTAQSFFLPFFPAIVHLSLVVLLSFPRRGKRQEREKVKRLEGADVRHLPAFISFYPGHPLPTDWRRSNDDFVNDVRSSFHYASANFLYVESILV